MKKLDKLFSKRNNTFIVLFLYLLVCSCVLLKTGGLGDLRYTVDFEHYHMFWHRYLQIPLPLSELSKELFESSPFADQDVRPDWIPNPLYSIIALFPLTIFGSIKLINIFGIFLGCIQVISIQKIAYKFFPYMNNFLVLIAVSICILNKWFICETIGMTTMSLATFFFLFSIILRERPLAFIFHLMTFAIRPNYLFFYLPLFSLRMFSKPVNKRNLIFIKYLSILPIGFLIMRFVHSYYPGTGLNYIFLSSWQGMDFIDKYFPSYLILKGFSSKTIIEWDASLLQTIKALLNLEVLNYVINLWFHKLLINLGFRYEESFVTNFGGFISEISGAFYSFLVTFPAFFINFYTGLVKIFLKQNYENCIIISSLSYLILTSILIGSPRLGIIVMPILILSLIDFLSNLKTKINVNSV